MLDTGLKDKVVLVTGANHGIGAAIALAFAREGVRCLSPFSVYLPLSTVVWMTKKQGLWGSERSCEQRGF